MGYSKTFFIPEAKGLNNSFMKGFTNVYNCITFHRDISISKRTAPSGIYSPPNLLHVCSEKVTSTASRINLFASEDV